MLPLDDRRVERFNSDLAGRPQLVSGDSQLLFGGMGRLSENSVINLKNKSHSVTAEIERAGGGANGVIIAQGGAFGGWSLYLEGGRPKFCYNLFGLAALLRRGRLIGAARASTRCAWSSPTTAAASAKAAPSTLYIDGGKVGEGRVEGTVPMLFSADETTRRRLRERYHGQRRLLRREQPLHGDDQLGADRPGRRRQTTSSAPDERLRVAMARQ